MKTQACVYVNSAEVLAWLGHRTVLEWSLLQLLEVRGIDRIACCVAARHMDAVQALVRRLADPRLVIVPLPRVNMKGGEIRQWFCATQFEAKAPGALVFVVPVNPFLGHARIEECVDLVRRRKQLAAFPAVERQVIYREADQRMTRGMRPAVVSTLFVQRSDVGDGWESRFAYVPVKLCESLSVVDKDERRLAQALVTTGTV